MNKTKPVIGTIYRHYSDPEKTYEILHIARNATNGALCKEVIVYKALYKDKEFGKNAIWVRDIKEFQEVLLYNGKMTNRFEPIVLKTKL